MTKTEPTPQDPIEQEDGSLVWPTDPDYDPGEIAEQDLTPVEVDEDWELFDDEDDEEDDPAQDDDDDDWSSEDDGEDD
jgi:hypothetical protein